MLKKKKSLTAFCQALKNATTMNPNFAMGILPSAGFPAALHTISILFFNQQRNHILHFLCLLG